MSDGSFYLQATLRHTYSGGWTLSANPGGHSTPEDAISADKALVFAESLGFSGQVRAVIRADAEEAEREMLAQENREADNRASEQKRTADARVRLRERRLDAERLAPSDGDADVDPDGSQ